MQDIKRFLEEDIQLGEWIVINPYTYNEEVNNEIIGALKSYNINNNNLTLNLELENKCKINYIIENIKAIVTKQFTSIMCITENANIVLEVF